MSRKCEKCTKDDKTNKRHLDTNILNIIYESSDMITSLCLPRKYTTTHNDVPPLLFAAIGHDYNKRLLSSEEVINAQTQIVGKWIRREGEYEIHFAAIVSTEKNPQAQIRNTIICRELGVVLESIAFAETSLLKLHPKLGNTKIYVHFRSIDPTYNRTEYWNTLGYWASKKDNCNCGC
jgi:hypothetical protein